MKMRMINLPTLPLKLSVLKLINVSYFNLLDTCYIQYTYFLSRISNVFSKNRIKPYS